MNDNAAQSGESRGESLPQPTTEDFARRVFEAGDVVQIVVVELFEEWLPSVVDQRVVDEPACLRVDGPFDDDLHTETMTVQALTLVAFGDMRKSVCSFEADFSNEADVHRERQLASFSGLGKLLA